MNPIRLRREFLKTMVAGSCALPLSGLWGKESGATERTRGGELDPLLPDFDRLTPEEKVRRIERVTHAARIHPSGILVCMPYVADDGLRVVRTSDFEGMDQFSFNFGHKFKAITDFFTNENSITTSGSHLAAQSIRYQATGEAAAMAAARVAYRSLRIVYGFGVEAGNAGFMGKPFHFEYSVHTTGDQYLHAMWGLWTFYPIASPDEQAEIRAMFVTMADYQIKVDYTIFNRTGGGWNNRLDPTDYNAIMAALVAVAYKFSGDRKYRDAYEFVVRTGKWQTHRRIDYIIEQFRDGTYKPKAWDKIAGADVGAGEFAHWEQIQHCQFTAISAAIIHECVPDLFTRDDLRRVLALWWADHPVGFDSDRWNYLYWFIISTKDRSWRPVELTPRLPREAWFGGHPMLSFASKWVYGDCLARFQWTAMVVARHCPEKRDEAAAFAATTLRKLQPRHLLWISDPDGRQIPPEVNYFTRFLSSEVPENVIASYWEGRRLKLWA
ncbi:MAG TPA: hypothetical protein PKX00_10920 [Opitutaceae bacterium]|nr:hypothetical protein [Opitutaceae bacterium]